MDSESARTSFEYVSTQLREYLAELTRLSITSYRSRSLQSQHPPLGATAMNGSPFAALQNLANFMVPPLSSPFSWSFTRGAEEKNINANDDKIETEKKMGFVSKERQLVRLRERMAEEGVFTVARLVQKQVTVPCGRCVDRVVAP